MTVSGFSGTAGDDMNVDNGGRFHTIDTGNNCVNTYKGAWLRKGCLYGNLNGMYFKSSSSNTTCVSWYYWKNTHLSLRKTEMKIRPTI